MWGGSPLETGCKNTPTPEPKQIQGALELESDDVMYAVINLRTFIFCQHICNVS